MIEYWRVTFIKDGVNSTIRFFEKRSEIKETIELYEKLKGCKVLEYDIIH